MLYNSRKDNDRIWVNECFFLLPAKRAILDKEPLNWLLLLLRPCRGAEIVTACLYVSVWICLYILTHLGNHASTHTQPFTALWTLSRTSRVSWYQKVHCAIFWIFWCKMKITQAETPTIRMDCHPFQTNWCPHLCHPHIFYAGCPSWHNPPNLSWLGTGTKYAGLHTRLPGGLVKPRIQTIKFLCMLPVAMAQFSSFCV